MTPTPIYRPYSIYVEKRLFWALRTISKGLVGDGQLKPELTADGIANHLLAEAIETKWPKLLDGYKAREAVDADYIKRISEAAAKESK